MDTGAGNLPEFLLGAVIGLLVLMSCALLLHLAFAVLGKVPRAALLALAAAFLALLVLASNSVSQLLRTALDTEAWTWSVPFLHGLSAPALFVVVLSVGSVVGGVMLLATRRLREIPKRTRILLPAATMGLVTLAALIVVGLIDDGGDPFDHPYRTLSGAGGGAQVLEDPAAPGKFGVDTLTYGYGDNQRRPEFGGDRDLDSRSVDASPLLPEWRDLKKKTRERFWGFGLADTPLNGSIWLPRGDGPFPLALIVHGNHGMEDFSDPGYAYLGELLASRGMIAVSVDQNFINSTWSGDFRGKEMPLRAWLLLEHLKLWREWNATDGHRIFGKVDLRKIALIGHSRGGEAVSIAYAFNELAHYPDDATYRFDYGFDIQSLVAIAQVDQRYHRRLELEDVNFLTLHGSYDSDEPAYHGMRQYNRIRLSGEPWRLKAGIYIHRANHGQFNSTWGREDASAPQSWLLNLSPIIEPQHQRRIAAAYTSAFLEVTLLDNLRFAALLLDPRAGADWLPDQAYVQQFADSTFSEIATFDEDLDVTTASLEGAVISTSNLSLWREEELMHRDERPQGTKVAVIGWRSADDVVPEYTIRLSAGFAASELVADRILSLSLSGSTEQLPVDESEDDRQSDNEKDVDDDDIAPVSPDFTVELEDGAGNTASIAVSEHASVAPPLRVQYLKSRQLNERDYNEKWEPVLQTIDLPVEAFQSANPEWQPEDTRVLRFKFDRQAEGVIILDNIGLRRRIN